MPILEQLQERTTIGTYGFTTPFLLLNRPPHLWDLIRARYYDPGIGRFIQEDPLLNLLTDLTDPGTLDLYSYADNNPVNLVDPTGLQPVGKAVGKLVELCVSGFKTIARTKKAKHVQEAIEEGEDVLVRSGRKGATEFGRKAGGGKRPRHDIPRPDLEKRGHRRHVHLPGSTLLLISSIP